MAAWDDEIMQAEFVTLPDGRRIAYREMGCTREKARRSLLVLHGLGSSRLAGMPGVSADLLKQFGVRLVSIDRAGYGLSDSDPAGTLHSASRDLVTIMDELELGEKVWLLGFSCGGAFCWAAARYIPDRVAGIAMWCPVGSYDWKGVTKAIRTEMQSVLSNAGIALYYGGKYLPFFVIRWYVRLVVMQTVGAPWVKNCETTLPLPDCKKIRELPGAADFLLRDNTESMTRTNGFGMARDMHIVNKAWGMDLEDVGAVYKGKIHIWQGDADNLIPIQMQRFAKQQLPEMVQLHELKGEGHLSWFCFNDAGHLETLSTLFGESPNTSSSNEQTQVQS